MSSAPVPWRKCQLAEQARVHAADVCGSERRCGHASAAAGQWRRPAVEGCERYVRICVVCLAKRLSHQTNTHAILTQTLQHISHKGRDAYTFAVRHNHPECAELLQPERRKAMDTLTVDHLGKMKRQRKKGSVASTSSVFKRMIKGSKGETKPFAPEPEKEGQRGTERAEKQEKETKELEKGAKEEEKRAEENRRKEEERKKEEQKRKEEEQKKKDEKSQEEEMRRVKEEKKKEEEQKREDEKRKEQERKRGEDSKRTKSRDITILQEKEEEEDRKRMEEKRRDKQEKEDEKWKEMSRKKLQEDMSRVEVEEEARVNREQREREEHDRQKTERVGPIDTLTREGMKKIKDMQKTKPRDTLTLAAIQKLLRNKRQHTPQTNGGETLRPEQVAQLSMAGSEQDSFELTQDQAGSDNSRDDVVVTQADEAWAWTKEVCNNLQRFIHITSLHTLDIQQTSH